MGCETWENLMSAPAIARVVLYVKDLQAVAAFYERLFKMKPLPGATNGWIELASPAGGCTIALHKAAKSQKSGTAIKLVFGVPDVPVFVREKEQQGFRFGVIHRPDGFEFANAKDPAGNSISVSSRGL
jgi:predicted enzyme related to lactoylglutathione lyase